MRLQNLGYATTVHRSQGMTVGSCHVLAGANMDRQSLYVALSRGKNTNIVYAAHDELPDWDFEHHPDEHPGAMGLLAKIIARDGSQRTVHQMIEDEQRKAASWSTITNSYMLAVGELYEDYTEQLLNRILTDEQFGWVHGLGGWDQIVTSVAQSETFGWDTEALLRQAASVMSAEGKAGRIDTDRNSPGRVIARALKERIDAEDAARLPRRRTDAVAAYRVPALTEAAAEADPILAAYARSCEQQMHAFIDSYTTTALERSAPWIVAVGQRGTDPRRVRRWESTVREIAISRVLAHAPDDENDPMAHLREARKTALTANIARLHRPEQATDEVVGPYARYTDAELNSARALSRGRLTEDAMLLSLAKDELDRARGEASALGAVERSLAQVEIDERNIAAVRAARACLDALTRSPQATEQQIDAARAAVAAAEQVAPLERRWAVIERGAQHYRAAEAAKARARATDDQALGRITDRITRLDESIATERTILGQIDAELARRNAGGTDYTTGNPTRQTQVDSSANAPIDRDPLEHDNGPEREL